MANIETFRAAGRFEPPQMSAAIVNAAALFAGGLGGVLILATALHAFEARPAAALAAPPVILAAEAVSDVSYPPAQRPMHRIKRVAPVASDRPVLPDAPTSSPVEIDPRAEADVRPSFPCVAVRNRNLKLICATPALAQADEDLAEAYRTVLDKSPAPDTLREAQLEWVRQRNAAPAEVDSLLAMYQDRTNQLHALETLPSVN